MEDTLRRAAIVYDFDGTLSPGYMQNHSLLPALGFSEPRQFWEAVKAEARAEDADEILVYMRHILDAAERNDVSLTREFLMKQGKECPLFNGVEEWFDRINSFAKKQGLVLEHYIASSGIEEMIEGSPIAPKFRRVFASRFMYRNGVACWPATAVNYTTKTQLLFRINKGIENVWDNDRINKYVKPEERPIPFSRMLFIGDGETDVPAIKMTRFQGGEAIAVFDPATFKTDDGREKVYRLIADNRVTFVAPADYSPGSQLDVTVKGVLARFASS